MSENGFEEPILELQKRIEALSGVGDKLVAKAKELALQAVNPLAWVSAIGEQAVAAVDNAVQEVGTFVNDTATAVNDGLQNLASQGAQAINQTVGLVADVGSQAQMHSRT